MKKQKEKNVKRFLINSYQKDKKRYFDANLLDGKHIPLRFEKAKKGFYCVDTKQEIYCLMELEEHNIPPHEIGNIILLTEKQLIQLFDLIKFVLEAKK